MQKPHRALERYTPSVKAGPESVDLRASFDAGEPVVTRVRLFDNRLDVVAVQKRRGEQDLSAYERAGMRRNVATTRRPSKTE